MAHAGGGTLVYIVYPCNPISENIHSWIHFGTQCTCIDDSTGDRIIDN